MKLPNFIRESKLLRRPLLAASKGLFSLLRGGPPILRRAAYDAMPVPYLVAGHPEHFVVSTADKVIGREVFLHGEFDFAKLQTALAILEREGQPAPIHLIDVGANIGTITIPALKRGLLKTATAIEPHPHNLRLLRANIALNGLEDRVTVLAQAVGDRSGVTLHLHESATNSGNHSIGGGEAYRFRRPGWTTWTSRRCPACSGWISKGMRGMRSKGRDVYLHAIRQLCASSTLNS